MVGGEFLTSAGQQPSLSMALEARTSWSNRILQAREGPEQPLKEGKSLLESVGWGSGHVVNGPLRFSVLSVKCCRL